MDKARYLLDPCGASSLPFWKTNIVAIPDHLMILREGDPRLKTLCRGYIDTPYFKLIHRMEGIGAAAPPKGFHFISPSAKALSEHIAVCYAEERASKEELLTYRTHPAFSSDLWLAIVDHKSGCVVASGVAELDPTIREGILEWIQVSPTYRRQGWGRTIVRELLFRMKGRADFVTVSGKLHDPSNPRTFYEGCGFEGGVVWHVLRKE